MLSVIVSALSFVVIVIVTVVLVNKSIDDESKRKNEMRKVVDQVNTVNDTASTIERKQNATLSDINTSVEGIRKDMNVFKTDYLKKTDITNEISSKTGKFDTLSLSGKSSITHDDKTGLQFKVGEGDKSVGVVGFDTANSGKRILVGSELSLFESGKDKNFTDFDTIGDVFVKTENDKKRLLLQNGKGPGIVLKENKVGIGADPVHASLDVKGNIAVLGEDIMMGMSGGSNAVPFKAFSVKDNTLFLNPDNGLTGGVNFPSDVVFGGNVILNNATLKSSANDQGIMFRGDKLGIGMEPKEHSLETTGNIAFGNTLYMGETRHNAMTVNEDMLYFNKEGSLKNVNINGDLALTNEFQEDKSVTLSTPDALKFKVGQSVKNNPIDPALEVYPFGTITKGMSWGDAFISQNTFSDNVYQNRNILANDNLDFWTVYHNNDKDLVFNPGELTTLNSTGEASGVINMTRDGSIVSKGNANFRGKVDALGDIATDSTLLGRSLCLKTSAEPLCLQQDDVLYVRQQAELYRKGDVPATQKQITLLSSQLQNIQDQITAMSAQQQ